MRNDGYYVATPSVSQFILNIFGFTNLQTLFVSGRVMALPNVVDYLKVSGLYLTKRGSDILSSSFLQHLLPGRAPLCLGH